MTLLPATARPIIHPVITICHFPGGIVKNLLQKALAGLDFEVKVAGFQVEVGNIDIADLDSLIAEGFSLGFEDLFDDDN